MTDYPVRVDVTSPVHFDRIQLVLRLALAIVLGWFGVTAGWLVLVLYGALPVIAAVAISSLGPEKFAAETAPRVWTVLTWLLRLSAYMGLLVDRFPAADDASVRVELRGTAHPTLGSSLARLVTSIPSGLVLGLLWLVSGVLSFFAIVWVIAAAHVPASILSFQRGVLRWNARLVAYHASLVDEYPPFAFDTGDGHDAPLAATGAR